ncbi:ATP-binding protein [Brasilonema sp. UFV-L1]|uniref:GAF domain-containing sensor histidine kinase n=1 Tax=Brasilonema sp. UFV-L1 TaxID=2234130 RepID=UPI00145D2A88|nr:ATP-binding protein [Brasilonema sp. UFV-L1]NMG11850.1 sensor histidine kinase [Brasilonema sp. UFV-L1]
MSSSADLSFSRTLPNNVFHQLGELLEQMAQAVGKAAVVLTEAVLIPVDIPQQWQMQRFTVVVCEQFSALLVGFPEQVKEGEGQTFDSALNPLYSALNVRLTFDPEAIASFVSSLRDLFEPGSHTYEKLEHYRQIPVSNDATLQCQFSLLLLKYFLPQQNSEGTESFPATYPHVSVCQPVEHALQKQIAQERLLNQVTTQIRKSLDLPVIVATAVAQVREFLELDRLVVYKFERSTLNTQEVTTSSSSNFPIFPSGDFSIFPSSYLPNPTLQERRQRIGSLPQNTSAQGFSAPNESVSDFYTVSSQPSGQDLPKQTGCVIYEVRAHEEISSVLNYTEGNCITQTTHVWDKFSKGFTLAVDDVEKTYPLEECLLNFLREARVRAKLASPIMYEEKLWGLLIAHQCNTPRHWSESEKNLLRSVAEQLAVAIHQAELMRSLTQEKQTLEQRVVERTIALHDALVAAQAASRLRSEFLATISHELLTPLTYVIGMSSTLLRWSFGELTQRQRDYLQTIHDSGEHLLEMINDILDLSQIEAGKAVLDITEFSLINIAESTVNALKEKATTQRVNLRLDVQLNAQRDLFTADTRRVQQILWNLLTNAIKFTPEGGNVILRLWVEDNTAMFQVEDTGIGIPEEQLSLLFEKFHQLDTPYRRRYGGTGLGLALTKQLVELHRGRIEVESTPNVGSIFTVWIPAQALSSSEP